MNAIFFNGMKIEHDKNCINKICKIVQLDFKGGGGYYIEKLFEYSKFYICKDKIIYQNWTTKIKDVHNKWHAYWRCTENEARIRRMKTVSKYKKYSS